MCECGNKLDATSGFLPNTLKMKRVINSEMGLRRMRSSEFLNQYF